MGLPLLHLYHLTAFYCRHTLEHLQTFTPECFNAVTFETPGSVKRHRNSSDALLLDEEDGSSVTVAVRVRPFSQR